MTYLLYQHSQYTAFYHPNKTEAMIITPGKSVTMGDLKLLQRLINLSPYENKAFSLKFPSMTSMMIRMPFLYTQVCNHSVRLTVR